MREFVNDGEERVFRALTALRWALLMRLRVAWPGDWLVIAPACDTPAAWLSA